MPTRQRPAQRVQLLTTAHPPSDVQTCPSSPFLNLAVLHSRKRQPLRLDARTRTTYVLIASSTRGIALYAAVTAFRSPRTASNRSPILTKSLLTKSAPSSPKHSLPPPPAPNPRTLQPPTPRHMPPSLLSERLHPLPVHLPRKIQRVIAVPNARLIISTAIVSGVRPSTATLPSRSMHATYSRCSYSTSVDNRLGNLSSMLTPHTPSAREHSSLPSSLQRKSNSPHRCPEITSTSASVPIPHCIRAMLSASDGTPESSCSSYLINLRKSSTNSLRSSRLYSLRSRLPRTASTYAAALKNSSARHPIPPTPPYSRPSTVACRYSRLRTAPIPPALPPLLEARA